MRFLAIFRPGRQAAPSAADKVGYWQACRDYIAQKQTEDTLEAYYWTNVLPPGLSAPKAMAGVGILNVESVLAAHELLLDYPGTTTEEGLAFELIPILNGDMAYLSAEQSGYRYLAMGKPTRHRARPAPGIADFAQSCQTCLQKLSSDGVLEYAAWANGPDQVNAYFFLKVTSHEQLYAALRCYPATALEVGYQWQFHTLLDAEYCFNSMIEEAKAMANANASGETEEQ